MEQVRHARQLAEYYCGSWVPLEVIVRKQKEASRSTALTSLLMDTVATQYDKRDLSVQ